MLKFLSTAYWWAVRLLLLFCLYCLADGMYMFTQWLASDSASFIIMFRDWD